MASCVRAFVTDVCRVHKCASPPCPPEDIFIRKGTNVYCLDYSACRPYRDKGRATESPGRIDPTEALTNPENQTESQMSVVQEVCINLLSFFSTETLLESAES